MLRGTKRSASDGYSMADLNIQEWHSAQEVYNKFDLQHGLPEEGCVRDRPAAGGLRRRFKEPQVSFQFASLLENSTCPMMSGTSFDEYRRGEQASGQKDCQEVFDCPHHRRRRFKRSLRKLFKRQETNETKYSVQVKDNKQRHYRLEVERERYQCKYYRIDSTVQCCTYFLLQQLKTPVTQTKQNPFKILRHNDRNRHRHNQPNQINVGCEL